MRTVGVGAKKEECSNIEELKKENKSLKAANTKLTKQVEELTKQVDGSGK